MAGNLFDDNHSIYWDFDCSDILCKKKADVFLFCHQWYYPCNTFYVGKGLYIQIDLEYITPGGVNRPDFLCMLVYLSPHHHNHQEF